MPSQPALSNLDAARAYFKRIRKARPQLCEQSYLLHLPSTATSWVGIGAHRIVHYSREGFETISDGKKILLPASSDIFRDLRGLLDPAHPCFFLVSLDIARPVNDPSLPLITFMQPEAEVCFSGQAAQQPNVHAAGAAAKEMAMEQLLEIPTDSSRPGTNNQSNFTPAPWNGEDDAHFLKRLGQAVDTLQSIHGKMIITRTYSKRTPANADPFHLFEIYSNFEPNAAACHYAALGNSTSSIGCSPENIFEMSDRQLAFDVVASTRGISADPEQDARWLTELQTDAKERKEHSMALERYQKRMQRLCSTDSVTLERHMDVRTLKHVRHLYSRISGTLQPDMDFFDMLHDSFPPLSSYPDELIPLSDPGTEPTRYYGGMVGRLGAGRRDACCFLNLRAALLQNNVLHTQGGVGVIRESIPRQELLEVANKLRSLKEAVSAWEHEAR